MNTKNPTVASFCWENDACEPGWQWASRTGCKTMAQLWARADMLPAWRIWIATREGVCSDVDMRLFACWCATRVPLINRRSKKAIVVAVRFALGQATAAEMMAAMIAVAPRSHAEHAAYHSASHYPEFANYAAGHACCATPASRRTAHRAAQAKQLMLLVGNPFKETK